MESNILITIIRQAWFDVLEERDKHLVRQAVFLLDREKKMPQDNMILSYGYLVFSSAKAYEGFLKKMFLQFGYLSERAYRDDHFRIGRSLNPDLPMKIRSRDWVYQRVVDGCSQSIAQELWLVWQECRNKVFHAHVNNPDVVTLEEAEIMITRIINAMKYLVECERIVNGSQKN